MRQFATVFEESEIAKQPVSQLPWGHIVVLMQKVKDKDIKNWYIQQIIENGWSRPTLEKKISGNLYEKQGINDAKVSNYLTRLPDPQSGLAQDLLKDPYNLDFLGLHEEAQEREIENELTKHITQFLLELGKGFAFLGRQVPIEVNGHEFFIDILLYHVHLHCYVIVELLCGAPHKISYVAPAVMCC